MIRWHKVTKMRINFTGKQKKKKTICKTELIIKNEQTSEKKTIRILKTKQNLFLGDRF